MEAAGGSITCRHGLRPLLLLILVAATFQTSEQSSIVKVSDSVQCSHDMLEGDGYKSCLEVVDKVGTEFFKRDGAMNLFSYCCTIKAFKQCMIEKVENSCGRRSAITDYTGDWVDEKVAMLLGAADGKKHVCSEGDYQFVRISPFCWPEWGLAVLGITTASILICMIIFAIICFKARCAARRAKAKIANISSEKVQK